MWFFFFFWREERKIYKQKQLNWSLLECYNSHKWMSYDWSGELFPSVHTNHARTLLTLRLLFHGENYLSKQRYRKAEQGATSLEKTLTCNLSRTWHRMWHGNLPVRARNKQCLCTLSAGRVLEALDTDMVLDTELECLVISCLRTEPGIVIWWVTHLEHSPHWWIFSF